MKVVFLDKDGTLGKFERGEKGLFPGTTRFLIGQRAKGRRLYVATDAGAGGKKHVKDLPINGYFERVRIDPCRTEFYVKQNGRIERIHDDYQMRFYFETEKEQKHLKKMETGRSKSMSQMRSERSKAEAKGSREEAERLSAAIRKLQLEINSHFEYWEQMLNKDTREPLKESARYVNPYAHSTKDLLLAKRRIAPKRYTEIDAAMVGNYSDRGAVASDPQTPLIVVSDRVTNGGWELVERVLDLLFFEDGTKTWQSFERIFQSSEVKGSNDGILVSLDGIEYEMKKGTHNERSIYCP
ncbi:hypothetical protein KKF81_02805 [Candidatus Micrarchaeota archaeon]|nr:hypothetical protein [Candidatus Micrarchaeota archaeon]MBU1165852.1 hypothetical protein [Candidatus Micrarchaeota archaeon]MBU1887014.1 hypothetical protein [Candidatus Micrarchaeota archaeon]